MRKAAVVIGVNRTGTLEPLKSAASGAQRVADWLKTEGFKVVCLTDKDAPVKRSAVEEAIEEFVTVPPRYHLLLVYFSGHGYWQARSDVWLLSGAPVRTGEAINMETAMDLAKYSGIPNVVFVSDACRSLPDSRAGALVDGGGVFPNFDDVTSASKIDYFKATSEALPAYEGAIAGEPQSLLTAALMAAYESPDDQMVHKIVEGRETIEVVPNRRLEAYLQRKVDEILGGIRADLSQRIEVNVPSSDEIYLARVRRAARPAAAPPPPRSPAPVTAPAPAPPPLAIDSGREAAAAIEHSLSTRPLGGRGPDRTLGARSLATEQRVQRRLPDARIDHFETQMGFVVRGARVAQAVISQRASAAGVELLDAGDGATAPGVLRLGAQDARSIVIQLDNGRAVVLAALPGYIGHLTFNDAGLSNVSYVPSANHGRWVDYEQRREEIDRLRAMVALAVDRNTFRINGSRDANALAERIRVSKGVDPTLGLYAASAFSQAGNEEQLLGVLHYMRDDLSADLFDVRLLASRHKAARDTHVAVAPFCPMLTQHWHLLRSRRVQLPKLLMDASAFLCGSLWATFEPRGADSIIDAIRKGALQ